jgi:hypothetical protein
MGCQAKPTRRNATERDETRSGTTNSGKDATHGGFPKNPPPDHIVKKVINIVANPDNDGEEKPPPYRTDDDLFYQPLVQSIIDAVKSGYLDEVANRHIAIHVDDNYRLKPDIQGAIKLLAATIVQICRVYDCDATLYFTSRRNDKDADLTGRQLEEASFLDDLFETQSWAQAYNLVENKANSRADPTNSKLFETQNWTQAYHSRADPTNAKGKQTSVAADLFEWMKALDATGKQRDDKFIDFLGHVQDLMLPYWSGGSVGGIDGDQFLDLYDKALTKSRKQKKLLNSLGFTLKAAIERQRLQQQSSRVVPTTRIVVSGSQLQSSEINDIKATLRRVNTEKGQFAIQAVAVTGEGNKTVMQGHTALDDAVKGTNDIYDAMEVPGLAFLMKCVIPETWGKMFTSHDPKWDAMNLKMFIRKTVVRSRVYSEEVKYIIPTLKDLREYLGIVN